MSPARARILGAIAVLAVGASAVLLLRGDTQADGAIVAAGTVEATTSDVGFAAGGRITEVFVQEGEAVSAGQLLARLDVAELEARRALAEAQVAAAGAQLDELRRGPRTEEIAQARAAQAAADSRLADARRDAERSRRLFAGGAVSREALDKVETQLAVSEAQAAQAAEQLLALERGTRSERIRAAQAQLDQAEASLRQVEARIGNGTATAPFAGIITVRHREPGETVQPGAPVVTVLNPDDRWVRIYIRETDVPRVSIGRTARIMADGTPGESYGGRVVHIASEAEFTPRNVQTQEERTRLVYAVRVRVTDDPAHRLKPGLPVDVRIAPEPAAGTSDGR